MLIDNVMLYALLGAALMWGIFEMWITGQSDED